MITSEATPGAAAGVLAALERRGETLAVAESLTGGLLAAALVAIPGASRAFRGGLVVYATDLKATLAGVPEVLLAERGPVDGDVAEAMAAGAARRCGATWGLATTGVAGPDTQDGHAVGTVWIAAARAGRLRSRRLLVPGERGAVRGRAVLAALALLAQTLDEPDFQGTRPV